MRKSRPCFNKKGSIARTLPFICALLACLTTDFHAFLNLNFTLQYKYLNLTNKCTMSNCVTKITLFFLFSKYFYLKSFNFIANLYRISHRQHIRAYPLLAKSKYHSYTIRTLYLNPATFATINTPQFNRLIIND